MDSVQGRLWENPSHRFIHSEYLDFKVLDPGPDSVTSVSYSTYDSVLGPVRIFSTDLGIFRLDLLSESSDRAAFEIPEHWTERNSDVHLQALKFIECNSWSGPLIPLALYGTEFQLRVWKSISDIPRGDYATYGDIAGLLGDRNLSRAVGAATGSNPVAVLIPCHRVLPANGKPGAFRWGTEMKKRLLAREAGSSHAGSSLR